MATYLVLAAVTVACVAITVAERASLREPVHWGTFTAKHVSCEPARYGETCTAFGNWTADDGNRTLHDVSLDDGGFSPDEVPTAPVRAGWRDVDAEDDGLPTIVYDRESIDLGWVGPALTAVGVTALGVFLAGRWGDLQRLWRRWQRPRRRGATTA
ncbi:hypothetical protein [Curtobacterium sp. VKM Ac-2922]|uniref:hypothetical protein n=1 Tax=Curtobacterium sp. VKM Ac-2922 TaxID=2929475 RepID=UPI001FB4733A|nr:hypothetical protein [Curtobacterium sp. VKM Ac-2922]MCJ1713726.1 hypothetical protein [Curtobacterium sp. VKM Ac-2922]